MKKMGLAELTRKTRGKKMKPEKFVIALVLGLALHQLAPAQTNATSTNQPDASAAGDQTVEAAETPTNVSATVSNTTASDTTAAAISSNQSSGVVVSNQTTEESAAPASNSLPSIAPSNETASVMASNTTASDNTAVNISSNQAGGVAATNPPAGEGMTAASNSLSSITPSNEMAGEMATNQPTNAMTGGQTSVPTNAPVITAASNEVSSMTGTNAPAATTAGNETPNAASASTAENMSDTNTVESIPLIQFQDVPITAAIENLARQAGINYLLDPKIGYGQPDQNGQIKPEPTLSIRWENVTARQALLALLDNYGLQLIEDPKTTIARITIKDPTAPPPLITRVIQLKFASVSNMVVAIENTLTDRRSKVVPDVRTSQLVVVATDDEQAAVDTLVSRLDKPTRQVLIETHFIEVSSTPQTVKGIDWTGTLSAQNISFGNGVVAPNSLATTQIPGTTTTGTTTQPSGRTTTTTSTPGSSSQTILDTIPQTASTAGGVLLSTAGGFAPNIGFLSADGLHAVLSFLNSDSEAQTISTPRIVTLDNEMANIAITRAFPVFNTTAGTQGSPGGSSIGYTNVGTVLQVTPRISANNYIWLKVTPEVSSLFGKDTETIGGTSFSADIFDYRQIDTQVLIPNSNTLVMGGLVKDSPQNTYTKVPILGDIPVLGWAFRSENKSIDKDNLLIFITPTILKDEDFQPTETSFLKTTAARPVIHPNSFWDSARPYDWSQPNGLGEKDYDMVLPATNSAPSTSAAKP
jgi:type II secretory pathway component GspD/PulD (secretin)